MTSIQFNQITWYSKLIAVMIFFALPAWSYWLGFEYGKATSETEIFIRTASSSVPSVLSAEVKIPEYKRISGWSVFSHRLIPFQIQYPPEWEIHPILNDPEDMAPFFGASSFDFVKVGTSQVISIAFFQNTKNLSAEELSDGFIRREFARQVGQQKFTVTNKPYHIINGIRMIRRSDKDRNIELFDNTSIELIFKNDPYVFFIIARKEVDENLFLKILRTLKVGSEKDFPLYEEIMKEEAEKGIKEEAFVCPVYAPHDMDWCSDKNHKKSVPTKDARGCLGETFCNAIFGPGGEQ
ncbi:MAG: hypothetical protein WC878_04585 [Candidatus Paceibacterota bacterium]|jgi:hypothetical protein